MNAKRRFFWLLSSSALFATAACTLILDRDDVQCSTNGDCAKFAATATCVQSVCVLPDGGSVNEAGSDAPNDTNQPDVFVPTEAGIKDAGVGFDGCFEGTPTTNDQFLNACTPAECTPFDNCARLGICDDALPGVKPPDGGTAPGAAAADSGAVAMCADLLAADAKTAVYVTGSSNFPPFLQTFAPVLAKAGNATIWQVSNSCNGVDSIYNDEQAEVTKNPLKQQLFEAAGRTTLYFKPDGSGTTPCLLDAPKPVDVGESDIYAPTCAATLKYNPTAVSNTKVGEYFGPILPMAFIVPKASTQNVFSAEAGQAIFGRGEVPDAAAPLPFNDPAQFFIRASSTATNQIMSKGIFVDPTKWWGVDKGTATAMASSMGLVTDTLKQKTIGIISADFVDNNRGNIKALSFQARGQKCGFLPDSSSASFDKQNVRDGHYPLWGPIHFFTKLSGGIPTTVPAQNFVLRFAETQLDQDLVESMVKSHVIPSCAMKVTRDTEMGDIKGYDAPVHCGCFFDKVASNLATPPNGEGGTCKVCTTNTDCADQGQRKTCSYGFCER